MGNTLVAYDLIDLRPQSRGHRQNIHVRILKTTPTVILKTIHTIVYTLKVKLLSSRGQLASK